ncbi:zinc-dependent alcohol dehydrogenase family protein [Thermodesulfobacteriota bacterium]
MKAMILNKICEIEIKGKSRKNIDLPFKEKPLELVEIPRPVPGYKEVLIRVSVCGVCHTELDEIEGRLIPPKLPLILGHEVVGRIETLGSGVAKHEEGDRVGVAWIYSSCGRCKFCLRNDENLCEQFQATGLHVNGGYAQYMAVPEDFVYPIPERFSDPQAAPLLCAGVIGYRALRLSKIKPGETLGLYGFGASAHIAIQVAKHWGCKVFVFSQKTSGDHQDLAKRLGADWTGATEDTPPTKLDCAIDFTPVGEPVRAALRNLEKGGRVIVNAIRKTGPIPELEYTEHVWHEKELKSVANVARQDAREFLPLAAEIGIEPEVQEFELEEANHALAVLKQGKIRGAGVLRIP